MQWPVQFNPIHRTVCDSSGVLLLPAGSCVASAIHQIAQAQLSMCSLSWDPWCVWAGQAFHKRTQSLRRRAGLRQRSTLGSGLLVRAPLG
jgi:hypothetical protein